MLDELEPSGSRAMLWRLAASPEFSLRDDDEDEDLDEEDDDKDATISARATSMTSSRSGRSDFATTKRRRRLGDE